MEVYLKENKQKIMENIICTNKIKCALQSRALNVVLKYSSEDFLIEYMTFSNIPDVLRIL